MGEQKMIKRDEEMADLEDKPEVKDDGMIRVFASGATRDTAEEKYDPEGFFLLLLSIVFVSTCTRIACSQMEKCGTPITGRTVLDSRC